MISRRDFLLATSAALLSPPTSEAQQRLQTARLGYLGIAAGPLADAFLDGVRDVGYVEGQNLVVDRRQYEGNVPRLSRLSWSVSRPT